MSRFEGLAPDVLGVVLVGAEGCAETQDEPWLRDATDEERKLLVEHCRQLVQETRGETAAAAFDFCEFTVDANGRPYWVKAVLDHRDTPVIAKEKAQKFTRTLRVHVAV